VESKRDEKNKSRLERAAAARIGGPTRRVHGISLYTTDSRNSDPSS
jgi:hypothetical protein